MRIAVNTRLLVPDKMDGIARFTYETLLLISKNHPEVEFTFIFDRKVKEGLFHFPNNVKFISVSPPARLPILWYIWFEVRLKAYINKNNFDFFLSPEGWIPPDLNCKSLAVMHDLNFIHNPENIIYSHRKYLQLYFPKFAERATRIATVSEFSKQDIATQFNIEQNEIDVVFNGANHIFKPCNSAVQEKIRNQYANGNEFFLFIGTIHPRKNLEHLFLAFDKFKKDNKNNVQLLVAGNKKWWPQQLENTYESLTHKNDIIFLGRLGDEELAKILSSALALTYIPYFEGFGIPILEAFQAHTPVITSNVTSMPEIANGAALICEPKNIEQVADAMTLIRSDKSKREQLIAKGIDRANDFSWDRTAELLWQSIQKTLS